MQKFIDFVLRGKDLLSGKSDSATESIGQLKTEIKALDKSLKEVESNQENIALFESLTSESKGLEQALDSTKVNLAKFAKEQIHASAQVEKASQEYKALENAARNLDLTYKKQSATLIQTTSNLDKVTAKMQEQNAAIKSGEATLAETSAQYKKQEQLLSALEKKYKSAKAPTAELTQQYKQAKTELSSLGATQSKQSANLEKSRNTYTQTANEISRLTQSQATFLASLKETEQAISRSNSALIKQKNTQSESSTALAAVVRNYKAAAKSANKFESDLTRVNSSLEKSKAKLTAVGIDTKNLAKETENLANKQQKLAAQTTKAFNSLSKLKANLTGVRGAISKTKETVGGLTLQLTALAGTYLGIQELKQQFVSFVKTGASFETFRIQFEGIMGSAAEGEQAFQWVKQFAADTPLDMEQVTQSFITLKGAGLDPMDGILQTLTDSTAKYTGGTARLENIVKQLSQAYAKGKINTEDFNNANDNGLPVWELLAKATGKTVGELRILSDQSKLGRYALKQLFDEMRTDAVGASTALLKSFNGQLSVAKFNIQSFVDAVSQSGALDALTAKLTGLNAQFQEMANNGQLKQYAQEVSDSFVSLLSSVSSSLTSVFSSIREFVTGVKSAFAVASVAINVFTAGVRILISVWAGFIEIALKPLELLTSAFGLLPNAMSQSIASLRNFASEMRKTAINQASKDVTELHGALDVLTGRFNTAGNAAESASDKIGTITKAVEPLPGVMQATSKQALEMAINLLKSGNSLTEAGIPAERLRDSVALLYSKLKDDPSPAVQSVTSRLKTLYNSLSATVGNNTDEIEKQLEDLETEFQSLGGKTLENLQESVTQTLQIFNGFKEANKPVSELRQAFLKALDAQLKLSKAQNDNLLPSQLAIQASTLGLSEEYSNAANELDKYNDKVKGLAAVTERLNQRQQAQRENQRQTTEQTQQQTQAQEQLNRANAAAESHAGANLAFQKLWNEARERSLKLYDLSALSIDNLREKTKQLGSELSSAFRTQSWSSILAPINELNNAAKRNQLQAIEQEKAYRALFYRLEQGKVSIDELGHLTINASERFNRLDGVRLTALHNQIEIAKAATNALKDDLTSTINDLKNELDSLEGNQQSVLKRNFEADKAELQEKLKDAVESRDRQAIEDAKEALFIQQKIYDLRSAKITQETNVKNNITTNETVNRTIKTTEEASPESTDVSSKNTSSQPINNVASTRLVNSIEKLIKILSVSSNSTNQSRQPSQANNASAQTVTLEVILNGETYKADLQNGFEESFIQNLELQNSV